MPPRFPVFALLLLLPLFTGCTISASAGSASPTTESVAQVVADLQDPVEATRFHLEAAYGPDRLARMVTSIRTLNSVLVITMAQPPANLAKVDEYWHVCRTLAARVTIADIAPGKTAIVVIQPNGANVVYSVAGDSACKLA